MMLTQKKNQYEMEGYGYVWQYDPEKKYKVGVIDESLLTGGDV